MVVVEERDWFVEDIAGGMRNSHRGRGGVWAVLPVEGVKVEIARRGINVAIGYHFRGGRISACWYEAGDKDYVKLPFSCGASFVSL